MPEPSSSAGQTCRGRTAADRPLRHRQCRVRALREFAFEGARSPVAGVPPDDRQRLLLRPAADSAPGEHADKLPAVAERLDYARQRGGVYWPDLVAQVVDLARANGIAPELLADSRDRSWASLSALLEPPRAGETADGLDAALADAVAAAIHAVGKGDGTSGTAKALQELKDVNASLVMGRPLSWQQWAKLGKIKATKASNSCSMT